MAKRKYKSGTVRKRGKSYEICYRVNGKRQYETIRTDDEAVAENELRKRLIAIAEGAEEDRLGTKFGDLAATWLASKETSTEPRTYEHYESLLNGHILPAWRDDYCHQITRDGVSEFINLKMQGNVVPVAGKAQAGPLSAQTCTHILTIMKSVLSYGVSTGVLAANVAEGIDSPKRKPTELPDADSDDIKALLAAMPDSDSRLMTLLMVSLGLRIGEVLGLRGRDWNEANQELTIAGAVKTIRNSPYRASSGKTKSAYRVLKVSDTLADEITAKVKANGKDLLFTNSVGNVMSANNWRRRVWYPACAQAGIDLPIHGLRHIWATTQLAAGIPPHIVMSQGGWSSLAAMGNYAHLMQPSRLRAADTTDLYT
jgi:integrase